MFDTIILLTGPAEQAALAALLRHHNPALTIRSVETLTELGALAPSLLGRARLIGYVTPVVVPLRILDLLGFGAYNFHPGPPNYPGWLPAHFAIYDRVAEFGATAHVMVEKVDAGPIVEAELFPIPPKMRVRELEELAYVQLARLYWKLAPDLATRSEPLAVIPAQWGSRKSTRRLFKATCEIPTDISREELDRRVAAFGSGPSEFGPTVTLHGREFRYVNSEENAEAEPVNAVPEQHAMRRTG
jgi:methionyl-tRNA formyltransferase